MAVRHGGLPLLLVLVAAVGAGAATVAYEDRAPVING
jgi:hypothetical protein